MAEDEDVDPDQQGERQEAHHQAVDAEHYFVRSYSSWTKQLAKLTIFWKEAQNLKHQI